MSTSMLASPISTCKLAISQINICTICRLLSLCAHQAHCVAIYTLATKLRSRDRASELVGSACFRNEDTVDAFNLCRTANIWRIARAMSRISFLVTPFSINVMIPFRSAPQAKRRKGRKKNPIQPVVYTCYPISTDISLVPTTTKFYTPMAQSSRFLHPQD